MSGVAYKYFRTLLLYLPPLAVVLGGVYVYGLGGRYVSTDNAYVRANIVNISSEIDGRVARVFVDDNVFVETNQVLFEIDAESFELELDAAEANLAIVQQQIESHRARYKQNEVDIRIAKELVRFLALEFERRRELAGNGHSTQAQLETAEHELATARQQIHSLEQKRLMVIADLGGRSDLPIEEHPSYLRAMVTRNQAALNVARTRIRAPSAGFLGNVTLEAGEQVDVGEAVFPLIKSSEHWIEANLKEVQLANVMVGQEATVEIDSYPGRIWRATVMSISPATGAEFSLLPAQNATGNWVKVVQRVPVKLQLVPTPEMPTLRAGMTATIEIDTEQNNHVEDFITWVLASTGDD